MSSGTSGSTTSLQRLAPQQLHFKDDGRFPNSLLPVLLYRDQLETRSRDSKDANAACFERLFSAHRWPPDWRDQIYDYHHYHSTAHEALGVAWGSASLMLGGPHGETVEVETGDVLVLPAGTCHCALRQSDGFLVVGAYPRGQKWDIMRGESGERPQALERIAQVPLPEDDPVGGILMAMWQTMRARIVQRKHPDRPRRDDSKF